MEIIEKLEEKLYSEEFKPYLKMFTKDCWGNSKRSKKIEFFSMLHQIIAEIDELVPQKFDACNLKKMGIESQVFYFGEDSFIADPKFFYKESNPYRLFYTFIFELAFFKKYNSNFENVKTDEEEKRVYINTTMSSFDDWSNYFPRLSEDFNFQPITFYSNREAYNAAYKLLKYVYKNYGMDNYVGDYMSALMLKNFREQEEKKKTEENYKIMEERLYAMIPVEEEKLQIINDWLSENISKLNELDDLTFYSLLNYKIMVNCTEKNLYYINKEFFARLLKGYDKLDELMKDFCLADSEIGRGILVDGKMYVSDWENMPSMLLSLAISYKYKHNLFFEIDDEELVNKAIESKVYLDDVENKDYYEYLSSAYACVELNYRVFNYYYKLIIKGIENSKLLNYGESLISESVFSKDEVFLNYTYGKTYGDVEKEQFESLKKQYEKKNGVKK